MSTRRHYVIAFAIVAIAVGGLISYSAIAQTKKPSAIAQILIVKRGPSTDKQQPFVEDYMATQVVLLKSQVIAERTAKNEKLNLLKLGSLKGEDHAQVIMRSLNVTRDKSDGALSTTLTLTINDLPKPDAIAFLNAIIETYSDYLNDVYYDVSKSMLQGFNTMQGELEERLKQTEREYDEFLKKAPILIGERRGSQAQRLLDQVRQRLAETEVKANEQNSRLQVLQRTANQKETEGTVKLRAAEWATKAGLERSQVTVENFLGIHRLEQAELEEIRNSLQALSEKAFKELRQMGQIENEEETIRARRDRARIMLEKVQQSIDEMRRRSDIGGYRVVIVTRPG